MDAQGRFLVAWHRDVSDEEIRVLRFNASGIAVCNGDPKVISGDAGSDAAFHAWPSMAVTPTGGVTVAWLGSSTHYPPVQDTMLVSSFNFNDDPPSTWPVIQPPTMTERQDWYPSATRSPSGAAFFGWAADKYDDTYPYNGLDYGLNPSSPSRLLSCNPVYGPDGGYCFVDTWDPCVAANSTNYFLAWENAEFPEISDTAFDVYLQIFDSSGQTLGSPVLVNEPGIEHTNSNQESPAIAVSGNRIVVVWVGDELTGCNSGRVWRVYARLFFWDSLSGVLSGPPQFRVDSGDDNDAPANAVDANPSVAFTTSTNPSLQGRFFVCWNGGPGPSATDNVLGRYISPHGVPMGQTLRVNQVTGVGGDGKDRRGGRVRRSTRSPTAPTGKWRSHG
jgi:hypothetical protein